jgi:hypothetical protein
MWQHARSCCCRRSYHNNSHSIAAAAAAAAAAGWVKPQQKKQAACQECWWEGHHQVEKDTDNQGGSHTLPLCFPARRQQIQCALVSLHGKSPNIEGDHARVTHKRIYDIIILIDNIYLKVHYMYDILYSIKIE